jgi:hypothetical protein
VALEVLLEVLVEVLLEGKVDVRGGALEVMGTAEGVGLEGYRRPSCFHRSF